jgi:hypothetical protein
MTLLMLDFDVKNDQLLLEFRHVLAEMLLLAVACSHVAP